ncbi:MAG: hypothetical protein WCW44_01555 [archaeon]|jgi:hypothetical protein
MGLFDFLKKKNDSVQSEEDMILGGAEDSSVLIPNHVKNGAKDRETSGEVFLQKAKQFNRFKVSGVYDTGTLTMVLGFVECGKLKKKMKAKLNGKELTIMDLKVGSNSVEELLANEEGSIFIKSKDTPLVKYRDILEFK